MQEGVDRGRNGVAEVIWRLPKVINIYKVRQRGKNLANLFLFGGAIYSTEGQRMWPTLGGDDEQATSSEKFIAKRAWCEEGDGTGNHPGKKSGLNIISITCRENMCEKHAY